MTAVIEIDKEISTGVYEDKVSGVWVQTRASSPDLVSWKNLDFGVPLFNYDDPVPANTVPNP